MLSWKKPLVFFLFLQTFLLGEKIETFYGPIEVEEPILLELIKSPPFERLKSIHQYGVAYYTTHKEEYTRYDHSLGVFAILRIKGASLEEQIAGLLHDVSHTVFSHVGDWLFGKENQDEDYQNTIHKNYLQQSGLEIILKKYGLTAEDVLPKDKSFLALEQPLPNLCADRIDYNIQGAYYQGFITKQEALAILEDLQFENSCWIAMHVELMTKLTRYSLFMTKNCWGSATNYLSSRWLADALNKGLEKGLLSQEEIHFGVDQVVWDKLISSEDPFIRQKMQTLLKTEAFYCLVAPEEADFIVKAKFRGVDPWLLVNGKLTRLTTLDKQLAKEYFSLKEKLALGWPIKLL